MVNLEQIKLLESKVTKTIDYVNKVTDENKRLKEKLDSYQVRIDELEVLILKFKEDQSLIEDGILSALDRLNQFEDAVGYVLSPENKPPAESTKQGKNKEEKNAAKPASAPAATAEPEVQNSPPAAAVEVEGPSTPSAPPKEEKSSDVGELDIF